MPRIESHRRLRGWLCLRASKRAVSTAPIFERQPRFVALLRFPGSSILSIEKNSFFNCCQSRTAILIEHKVPAGKHNVDVTDFSNRESFVASARNMCDLSRPRNNFEIQEMAGNQSIAAIWNTPLECQFASIFYTSDHDNSLDINYSRPIGDSIKGITSKPFNWTASIDLPSLSGVGT